MAELSEQDKQTLAELDKQAIEDLTKKRMDECIPVAREILRVIGEISQECLLGNFDRDEGNAYYRKVVAEKLLPFIEKADIRTKDIKFINTLVMQGVDYVKEVIVDTFETAEDNAVAYKFGKKHPDEIRVSDIIKAQQEQVANNTAGQSASSSTEQTTAPVEAPGETSTSTE